MRDINRIEKITTLLKAVWLKYPDLRFHQLVSFLFGDKDNYYTEDTKVEETLEKVLKK